MIYLDTTPEEFFKDKKLFKKRVQILCDEEGYPFSEVRIFLTKKSYGVAIDPAGSITLHRPHDQKFWMK